MIVITANDWRIYGNSVIILGMELKSTDVTVFLNKCFYLCFHAQEEYKVDIKKFITSSGDKLSFNFFGFIDNLKSQKETYGLIPIDVFYDDYCTKDILQKIEESFETAAETGGYTRLFLEYLFDERFKEEFNNMVKKLNSTVTNSYFSTKKENGLFSFDLITSYLKAINNSYKGNNEDRDYTTITDRKAVYSKHDAKRKNKCKKMPGWTEPLDNPFSMYKLYGQEKYSRIMISLLGDKEYAENATPEELLMKSTDVIFADQTIIFDDKTITKNIPKLETIRPIEISDQVYFLWLDKIRYDLQTFFDDYVPSELGRKIKREDDFEEDAEKKNLKKPDGAIKRKVNSAFKNQTFRESMYIGFKTILKEEKALYLKTGQNDFVYLKLSNGRRKLFSDSELITINKEFKELYKKDDTEEKPSVLDYTIREKLEYIINKVSKDDNEKWKEFLDRYNIYFSDINDDYSGNKKMNYQEEEHVALTQSPEEKLFQEKFNVSDKLKESLIKLFTISFKDEKQFVELMEKSITIFPSYNIKDYLKLLRGASDHPWARFWTVYNRNSEMNLYPEQKLFTKVMNHIETEFNKTLNEE